MRTRARFCWPTVITALVVTLASASCTKPAQDRAGGDTQAVGTPYQVTVTPPAAGAVGSAVAAQIKLVPRGGYKVNLEYPTKLTVEGPGAGATPAQQVLVAKDAAKIDAEEALFAPTAKLTAAGEHKFSATFKFSVCTPKQCELKTEKLSWVAQAR